MDDERYTAEEQALFDRELERELRAELPSLREEEIKTAAHRAAALELEQRRNALREELDSEVEVTASESPTELRKEANREAPNKLVLGLILLLLLLFILAISGRLPFGARTGAGADSSAAQGDSSLTSLLGSGPTATPLGFSAGSGAETVDSQTGRGPAGTDDVDALGSIPGIDANVSQLFEPYYVEHDGLRLFGYPISQLMTINGRQIQWFERGRLEHWPEYQGTSYEVQPGLVGTEYTDSREFPKQSFFTNRPGLRYFGETSHGVGGKFLDFWEAHGGLDVFGYPISDEVIEILPETGRYHTVQYFQRARMELHPEHAGTQNEVQLGLLGRALYPNPDTPRARLIPPVMPTAVPLP